MTHKDYIIPGTILIVTKELCISGTPGGYLRTNLDLILGSEIKVINKPKKYEGINCVQIEVNVNNIKALGFAYYCDIRYKTEVKFEYEIKT